MLDPFHVPILHARFSGNQFVEQMAIIPECRFAYTEFGVRGYSSRPMPDGRSLLRVADDVFPNVRLVGSPLLTKMGPTFYIGFVVPRDDKHFVIFTLARVTDTDELSISRSRMGAKAWPDLSEAEHQKFPGDYEAQKSQGAPWRCTPARI